MVIWLCRRRLLGGGILVGSLLYEGNRSINVFVTVPVVKNQKVSKTEWYGDASF